MKKVSLQKGKVKIKIKGKKPVYIEFPPLDKERERSVKVLARICKQLFRKVEILNLTLTNYKKFVEKYSSFVLKTNPFLFNSIQNLERWKVGNFEIEKSGIFATLPKPEIKKKYDVKDNFALVFMYGGKTLFHTRILIESEADEEKILEEYEKIRKLNGEILDIYGNFYDKSYDEIKRYIQQKFFPSKPSKLIKDFIEIKYFFEMIEKIEKSKPQIEEIEKEEKIEKEIEQEPLYKKPLEIIEKEIYEFLSKDFRELKSFNDKALYMRLKQINLKTLNEEQKRSVYQALDKYFSSGRNSKDLEDLMQTLNLIFFKSSKPY